MIGTFFDGLDKLYHHANLGKIVQRAPAVGGENMMFVTMLFCLFFCQSRSEAGALLVDSNGGFPAKTCAHKILNIN